MKGKATWINNEVEWVKWDGTNLDDIKALINKYSCHKIYFPENYEKTKELYISHLGTLKTGDYLTKTHRTLGWSEVLEIHSWKTFPRMINEDIGSGLSPHQIRRKCV